MRRQTDEIRKQIAILLRENTQMNTRITGMRKQTGKMRKQIATLLIESNIVGSIEV
jgi:regulator of replication initiation timing